MLLNVIVAGYRLNSSRLSGGKIWLIEIWLDDITHNTHKINTLAVVHESWGIFKEITLNGSNTAKNENIQEVL